MTGGTRLWIHKDQGVLWIVLQTGSSRKVLDIWNSRRPGDVRRTWEPFAQVYWKFLVDSEEWT